MLEGHPVLERVVRLAIEEDLGFGDVTTDAVVDPRAQGEAMLIAKEDLVLAGMPVFKKVFLVLDPGAGFEDRRCEGEPVRSGEVISAVHGRLSSILKAERPALNLLQRMCGIATLTRRFVERIGDRKARVLDTRKTAPGLRLLDKYAVRIGGGWNHRFGLHDGILIKDNHIAAAGSITEAVTRARRNAPHLLKVEVEVEDLKGLDEAIEAGADIVLLDNMTLEGIRAAVARTAGRVLLEVSGGVRLEGVEAIAQTGVDFISVGALTHSAKAADLSLEILPARPPADSG
jgi:nicotinate-nucleotide pyrophosphorylase (carboxylating)